MLIAIDIDGGEAHERSGLAGAAHLAVPIEHMQDVVDDDQLSQGSDTRLGNRRGRLLSAAENQVQAPQPAGCRLIFRRRPSAAVGRAASVSELRRRATPLAWPSPRRWDGVPRQAAARRSVMGCLMAVV